MWSITSLFWAGAGLVLGSVANALIYRLPRGISWTKGKSICPKCKHRLSGLDLIPLFSFLWLKGKCRYCHKPIPLRYLLVELGLAVGFAYFHTPLLAAILWVTVVIAVMDWESMLVSDLLVGSWAVVTLLFVVHQPLTNHFIGMAVGLAVIGGMWAISKGKAMGLGDVEIAAVLGLWLGWPKIFKGLWLAFILGAIVGAILLWMHKAKLKSQIPFGPFLILGGWLAFLLQLKYVLPF